jgi:hypothetical protein
MIPSIIPNLIPSAEPGLGVGCTGATTDNPP